MSMNMNQAQTFKYAVCVDNSNYLCSLELHKIYQVFEDPQVAQDGEIRVIDESGEDYIYSQNRFVYINIPPEVVGSFERAA